MSIIGKLRNGTWTKQERARQARMPVGVNPPCKCGKPVQDGSQQCRACENARREEAEAALDADWRQERQEWGSAYER